jgi:hypothetical protein
MPDAWLRLWNGDFVQAPGIVSPSFRVHAALLDGGDGSSIRGVDGLMTWIRQTRAAFSNLRFATEVDPLVDGRYAFVRWTAIGPGSCMRKDVGGALLRVWVAVAVVLIDNDRCPLQSRLNMKARESRQIVSAAILPRSVTPGACRTARRAW